MHKHTERTVIMRIEKEITENEISCTTSLITNEMLLERMLKAFEIKEKMHRQNLAYKRTLTKKKAGEQC